MHDKNDSMSSHGLRRKVVVVKNAVNHTIITA